MSYPPSPPWADTDPDQPLLLVPPRRRPRWSFVLAALTLLTTCAAGGYEFTPTGRAAGDLLFSGGVSGFFAALLLVLVSGLPYGLAVMAFFVVHELGHYVACRIYRVDSTPPIFLPVPPWPFLFGTLGAVIRIRTPIPTRRALFDIGIAGPLAGFVVATALIVAGTLGATAVSPHPLGYGETVFGDCLMTKLVVLLFRPEWKDMELRVGPVYMAGWLGMLATTMNLIPAGQLDGGHIVYALAPRWHQPIALSSGAFLLGLVTLRGLYYGELSTWMLWAAVVFIFGRRHPPLPEYEPSLGRGRQLLALAAALVLLLTFMPVPIAVGLH